MFLFPCLVRAQEVFHYVAKEQLLTSLGGEDDYDYRQDI
jgi:hypothetical protein